MDNIKIRTKLPIEPDVVLEGAQKKLDYVLVIGYEKDGEMYVSSSQSEVGEAIIAMRKAEAFLLEWEN